MDYDPNNIRRVYDDYAQKEDRDEKEPSLRTEIPRAFIQRYLKPSDSVLDAGGGAGINAIMMAQRCQNVTLLDLSSRILDLAAANIAQAGLSESIEVLQGDITDLSRFPDRTFSFVVCVGDSISYVLDGRFQAIQELVRVAKINATLVIGCDSKYGFVRQHLREGLLEEAIQIMQTSECVDGIGAQTHLYMLDEMRTLLEEAGCEILEVASTPTFTDTIDKSMYYEGSKWERLTALELEVCTEPELLGMGHHLLFIARKRA